MKPVTSPGSSFTCRTSHEVRGLKYQTMWIIVLIELSHLTRGAWIEILPGINPCSFPACRTSHEVRGLKYLHLLVKSAICRSHLTRGAWIEISELFRGFPNWIVAPHTRCVDWNAKMRTEAIKTARRTSHEVRGLKCNVVFFPEVYVRSHLTRGAWIEMFFDNAPIVMFTSRTSHEVRGLKL